MQQFQSSFLCFLCIIGTCTKSRVTSRLFGQNPVGQRRNAAIAWERRWASFAGAAGTEVTVTTTAACADARVRLLWGINDLIQPWVYFHYHPGSSGTRHTGPRPAVPDAGGLHADRPGTGPARPALIGSAGNLLDFRRIPAHNATMRKRVHIALAVVLVMLAGVMVWQVLRSHGRSRREYASC